jgi:WD40 repeat protein
VLGKSCGRHLAIMAVQATQEWKVPLNGKRMVLLTSILRSSVLRPVTITISYQADYPQKILITSVDKTLKIVSPESGEVDSILEPHKAAILSVSVHPRLRRYILTGSMDGS